MKQKGGRIIWTVYFDSTKPWSRGRRVPLKLAVEKPKLEEIVLAAKKAGYDRIVEDPDAKHPAWWFEQNNGRIIVYTDEKKSIVIRKIAEKLKEIRLESSRKNKPKKR